MDPQVQQKLMVWGAGVPGVLTLVVLLALWYLHTRKVSLDEGHDEDAPKRSGPRWALPVLLALGFLGANSAQYASIPWWSSDNSYRLPHALGVVALLGVLEGFVRVPRLLGFVLRVITYGGVFAMLAWGYKGNEAIFASEWVFFGWMGVGASLAALLATLHEDASESAPGWVDALGWLGVLGAASPVLFFNGYATGPLVLTGILSVLGVCVLVGALCSTFRLARGGVTVLVGAVLVVAIGATVHSEIRSVPAGVLLLGAASTGVLVKREGSKTIGYLLTRAVIAVLLIGGAGALAYHEHAALESGDDSGEYDPYAGYDG